MKPVSIIAIYLLFWSITLFAVLPFGVRTTREAGREPMQRDSYYQRIPSSATRIAA